MNSAAGQPPPPRAPAQSRPWRPGPRPAPVNDNAPPVLADPLVRAALRHFAQYRLSAVQGAREWAEGLQRAGDARASERWLAIADLLADHPG